MRKSSITRVLAIVLSMIMLLTGLPAPIYAESADMPVDAVDEQTGEIVVEDAPALTEDEQYGEIPEGPVLPTDETTATPVEDEPAAEPEAPTEDAAFPEGDTTPDDASGDDSAVGTDPAEETGGIPSDQPITEDMLEDDIPVEPLPEDEIDVPDEPVLEETPTLFSVTNPSRFSGDEEVRLGKESSNINGIIVRKKWRIGTQHGCRVVVDSESCAGKQRSGLCNQAAGHMGLSGAVLCHPGSGGWFQMHHDDRRAAAASNRHRQQRAKRHVVRQSGIVDCVSPG